MRDLPNTDLLVSSLSFWRRGVGRGWVATVALIFCGPAPLAMGLTINADYSVSRSTPPASDPDGLQLQSLVAAAVAQWEGIFQNEWYLDLDYYWTDLDDASSTLGLELTFNTLLGKPTKASIRFDSQIRGHERPWFFDPTPTSNGEFDLQQTLVGDLSAADRQAWYNGAPPDSVEVSYDGSVKPSAPSEAQQHYDLFSIVLHEMGHAVGLSPMVSGSETDDNDYDVPPALVGGAEMAIKTFSSSNQAHLAAVGTLMYPSFGTGVRRLPSATDVLAIASAAGWTDVDLPQRILRGDVDGSGEINGLDINPFVALLLDSGYQPEADMNEDDRVDGLDVGPFVEAVAGVTAVGAGTLDGSGLSAIGPVSGLTMGPADGPSVRRSLTVPEPATVLLLASGVVALLAGYSCPSPRQAHLPPRRRDVERG